MIKLFKGYAASLCISLATLSSAAPAYADITVVRPGSSTNVATMTKYFLQDACIASNTVLQDGWQFLGDVIAIAVGMNFCADQYDADRLAMACSSPQVEGKFPYNHKWLGQEGETKYIRTQKRLRTGGSEYVYPYGQYVWVAYGYGDCWNYKVFNADSTPQIQCSNATFGDSKYGVTKHCLVMRSGNVWQDNIDPAFWHHT